VTLSRWGAVLHSGLFWVFCLVFCWLWAVRGNSAALCFPACCVPTLACNANERVAGLKRLRRFQQIPFPSLPVGLCSSPSKAFPCLFDFPGIQCLLHRAPLPGVAAMVCISHLLGCLIWAFFPIFF